jgi:hypothetical protein
MQRLTSSAAAASCTKAPIAGRTRAATAPTGWHSHTWPPSTSSQLSHVPHGVAPPAQLPTVPSRQRLASTIVPLTSKRTNPAPPATASLLLT